MCLRAYPQVAPWAAFLRRSAATLISLDAYRVSKDSNSFFALLHGENVCVYMEKPRSCVAGPGRIGLRLALVAASVRRKALPVA